VVKMKSIAINKHYGKLKMKCFKMPNASYTNRCASCRETYFSSKNKNEIWT